MRFYFICALYVFCMDYHSGQTSRLYRILSRISSRGINLSDSAIKAIQGKPTSFSSGFEWAYSSKFYRELVAKYSNDSK